ncbi:MAG: formylmethanofuran dehydrogenase subunit B [Nitrososphaerota archaeon]
MKTINNVVCSFCGCLCDDIEVNIENNKIVNVKNTCSLGLSKFLNYDKHRILKPRIRKSKEFVNVSLEEAIDECVKILSNASYPIIYGWSNTSNEALRIGMEIAELIGGVIDNTTSVCHGPTIIGVQDIGESTSTLGQVKNRADLIIYWGSNPLHAHPRHLSRYTALSKGRFVKTRKERKIVVVDVRKTATASIADIFIQIKPNSDYELLSALRYAVNNGEIEQNEVAGVPVEKIEELAEMMISCKFGALMFGLGLTMSPGKHRNIEAAIALVTDLNKYTKFVILPMRGHYNVTGANNVTCWTTGYPFAVDFSKGYPYYNPGETTIADIIARGECDAALIVASDPISHLPIESARKLSKIPIVTIDPHETPTTKISKVVIPSSYVGIEYEGTAYRMDGVPLRLKKIVDPPDGIISDEEILKMILSKLRGD